MIDEETCEGVGEWVEEVGWVKRVSVLVGD